MSDTKSQRARKAWKFEPPKATVHLRCTQLLDSSFIARDVNKRDYVIGPALRKLSLDTLNRLLVFGLSLTAMTCAGYLTAKQAQDPAQHISGAL